eukprot:PhM_4_TR13326/c4_g1_i1/m.72715
MKWTLCRFCLTISSVVQLFFAALHLISAITVWDDPIRDNTGRSLPRLTIVPSVFQIVNGAALLIICILFYEHEIAPRQFVVRASFVVSLFALLWYTQELFESFDFMSVRRHLCGTPSQYEYSNRSNGGCSQWLSWTDFSVAVCLLSCVATVCNCVSYFTFRKVPDYELILVGSEVDEIISLCTSDGLHLVSCEDFIQFCDVVHGMSPVLKRRFRDEFRGKDVAGRGALPPSMIFDVCQCALML